MKPIEENFGEVWSRGLQINCRTNGSVVTRKENAGATVAGCRL